MTLDISEIARSMELYEAQLELQDLAQNQEWRLEFTKETHHRTRDEVGKVVVAFGSYDPFSRGHETLFLKGLETLATLAPQRSNKSLNELLVVTSTSHFSKKIDLSKNSTIFDRNHAQEGFAACYKGVSLALFNNPFFINLQGSLEAAYGKDTDLYYLVGADVLEKIVDASLYVNSPLNMEDVVGELFEHNFIVSKRNVDYKDGRPSKIKDKEVLIQENPVLEQYRDRIVGIELELNDPQVHVPIENISSTLIRGKRKARESIETLTAVGISTFVDKRSMYLEDPTIYEAFVCLRQGYVDRNRGKRQIGEYIHEVVLNLQKLREEPEFAKKVIADYNRN